MSRKAYDSTNDTFSLIAGRESVDVGLNSTSQNPVRNSALYAEFQKTYRDSDTVENALADSDNFPFYDVSSGVKRKTVWSNICEKIKMIVAKTGVYGTLADSIAAGTTYNDAIGTLLNNDRSIEAYLPIFAALKGRGAIRDALEVDLATPQSAVNRPGYVNSTTTANIPSDLYYGIRQVYYFNSALVWVRIVGITTGNYSDYCEWGNVYHNGSWGGWKVNTPLRKIVSSGTKRLASSGTLAAGANGYGSFTVSVPTNYKTTGIVTVKKNHPGTCYAVINTSLNQNATGTVTGYYTYYNPKAITYAETDFDILVECTNSSGNM